MNSYVASAPIRKHRCVARAGNSQFAPRVLEVKDSGQPVSHYGDAYNHRTLAAPGLAFGIATENAEPGQINVAIADRDGDRCLALAGEIFDVEAPLISDGEGRVVVARPGVRLSEPVLAIALEAAGEVGALVAVKVVRGMMT